MPSHLFSWTDQLPADGLLHAVTTVLGLALLEAVLSADNAVALAGLVQQVHPEEERRRVLNGGLLCAFLLRGVMILAAGWVLRFEAVRLLGGLYLIALALRHFQSQFDPADEGSADGADRADGRGRLSVIALVALTDLAFSLDSVSASVALTDELPLVLLGGAMGVVMLRFLAGWVIGWMDRFVHLANAAYLTVLAVGLRMLARVTVSDLAPSEPMLLLLMGVLFLWGFSRRREEASAAPRA